MTNAEAIKNIINDACKCCKTYFEKCDEKENCAYYMAIKSLEKQIPKKPLIRYENIEVESIQEYEAEIRADERRKFARWVDEHSQVCGYPFIIDGFRYNKVSQIIEWYEEGAEYEKEKKI